MKSEDSIQQWLEWGEGIEPPSSNRSAIWIYEESPGAEEEPLSQDIRLSRRDDNIVVIQLSQDGKIEETTEYPLTEENIDIISKKYNFRSGKWLIFEPPDNIDRRWKTIADAIEKGELGPSAKVSTAINKRNSDKHVICVYTSNYFDKDEVMQVREKLRELGIEERIYYKPDIYTRLRIYSGDVPFGASRYSK